MHLPGPLRAAVGLLATAVDEAKHLPDRAIELPMLVVSTALQASLRAQQRYAQLAARGDEVLTRREVTEQPPEWATFDEPLSVDELRRTMFSDAADRADDLGEQEGVSLTESMVESLFGVPDPAAGQAPEPDVSDEQFQAARRDEADRRTAAAKKTTSARKSTARKRTVAEKAAAKKTADTEAAADAGVDAEPEAGPRAAEPAEKTVNKPRHTAPSAFDDVADD